MSSKRANEQTSKRGGAGYAVLVQDMKSIQSKVRADLVKREKLGIERYGTALYPNNGRRALQDAYEEALDLACYLRQALEANSAAGISSELGSVSVTIPPETKRPYGNLRTQLMQAQGQLAAANERIKILEAHGAAAQLECDDAEAQLEAVRGVVRKYEVGYGGNPPMLEIKCLLNPVRFGAT